MTSSRQLDRNRTAGPAPSLFRRRRDRRIDRFRLRADWGRRSSCSCLVEVHEEGSPLNDSGRGPGACFFTFRPSLSGRSPGRPFSARENSWVTNSPLPPPLFLISIHRSALCVERSFPFRRTSPPIAYFGPRLPFLIRKEVLSETVPCRRSLSF